MLQARLKVTKRILLIMVLIVGAGSFVQFAHAQEAGTPVPVVAEHPAQPQVAAPKGETSGLLYIAIALCVGFSSIAAGWAVSTVGAAALGAISEKPELAGRALIFVGLAEGVAIYGLIVAIMLIGKA
jgi:V/A-type H+-transporting ATPase subunit K